MTQRHPIQADELMFITTIARHRRPIFGNPSFAREAVEALYRVQQFYPFFLFGFVIMPDHCHILLHVPDGGSISRIMGSYKRGVAHSIGVGSLWQPRFHIRIPGNISSVIRYMHLNPVKAGLVEDPRQYPWSSACGRWDVFSWE